MGMIGLDNWLLVFCAKWNIIVHASSVNKQTTANNIVSKVKSVVSPYFAANNFAFAYAA